MSINYHIAKFKMAQLSNNMITHMRSNNVLCKDHEIYSEIGGGFALYLQDSYVYVDIAIDNKVLFGINSDCLTDVKYASLIKPSNVKDVILELDTDAELLSGCGWRIFFDFQCIVDVHAELLQIGTFKKDVISYRILNNVYVQLKNDGQLSGILISNIKW